MERRLLVGIRPQGIELVYVDRGQCGDFKRLSKEFSYYKSLDHILFKDGEIPSKEKFLKIKDNWDYLKKMNVCKANSIVNGTNEFPSDKGQINQMAIFEGQMHKYVITDERVAVLNSFPIFIYEYFR